MKATEALHERGQSLWLDELIDHIKAQTAAVA